MNQALQDVIEHRRTTNVFEPNHTISDEQIEHLVHLATRAVSSRPTLAVSAARVSTGWPSQRPPLATF